jgi:Flp pilus assembly protein TadG
VRTMTHDPNQRGSAAIESALTLLTLMFFLIAILEAGRLVWTYNSLAYVAREGTRYAIVRGSASTAPATNTSVDTYVTTRAAGIGLDTTKMTTPFTTGAGGAPGTNVRVVVPYTYSMFTTLFRSTAINLTSTSQMVILH